MRICRLVWNFPKKEDITYGLGPNFYFISKEQVNLGLDVHVISRRKLNELPYEEIEGVKIHRVKLPYNVSAIRKVLELNKTLGIDVIHAHGTCGILYPLFHKATKIPLVVHVHATTLGIKQHAFRIPAKISPKLYMKSRFREEVSVVRQSFFWRYADSLIAVSKAQKEELKTLYGLKDEKIRVIYNGVDTSIFRRIKNTEHLRKRYQLENKQVILFVGHFVLRKGIPFLLEAMPYVLKENPDVFLLCVGGTPKWLGTSLYWDILHDMIKKKGLREHVRLVGEIPHHRLPYYYSLAEVFAFPSLYEAFAKVVLEAMACQTPVITSNVGGIPEIIEHNVNGVLIEPKNIGQLAEAINLMLMDKGFAKKIGENGRHTVEKRFTWHHVAKRILELYEDIL